jgi:hypothetical protein
LRKTLNTEFLAKLNADDLLPFVSDLTADNGDTAYGDCTDKVGILSCDLYRKYRKYVPLFGEWMWTCTPWYCDDSGDAGRVRIVISDGAVDYNVPTIPAASRPLVSSPSEIIESAPLGAVEGVRYAKEPLLRLL